MHYIKFTSFMTRYHKKVDINYNALYWYGIPPKEIEEDW